MRAVKLNLAVPPCMAEWLRRTGDYSSGQAVQAGAVAALLGHATWLREPVPVLVPVAGRNRANTIETCTSSTSDNWPRF
jgi:hypothetical protein